MGTYEEMNKHIENLVNNNVPIPLDGWHPRDFEKEKNDLPKELINYKPRVLGIKLENNNV